MPFAPMHYSWEWDLHAAPEAYWPLIADTDRFNRDTGIPAVQNRLPLGQRLDNARRQLRVTIYGVPLDFEEQPFEWVRPERFGVRRVYRPHLLNPLSEFRMLAELTPRPGGGTHLRYQVWATPANLLGRLAIPIQIGLLSRYVFDRAIRAYDRVAATAPPQAVRLELPTVVELNAGGQERLQAAHNQLLQQGAETALVEKLTQVIETADDSLVAHLRPYALAEAWGVPHRAALELCLRATRAGMLDLQWDVLCPNCRGARFEARSLADLSGSQKIHCDTCNIDYTANFERSVELTFHPNPAIRTVSVAPFCVAGPQVTPHIAVQQLLHAGEERTLSAALEAGRYRLRALDARGSQNLRVEAGGRAEAAFRLEASGWPELEPMLNPRPSLHFTNATAREQLFILERQAWSDQATTAADVTALQVFRDLFASEALRPGEQISVGNLTVLFTDLRGSTKLYREVGDAVAFGMVMSHFDILREAVATEGGAIVKTIGDAIMAVFQRPASALQAVIRAQRMLAMPPNNTRPLMLKVGIHAGPCIAVTLNEKLDYFGSTVNAASRLVELSNGEDVILSASVRHDPEVRAILEHPHTPLLISSDATLLKGFDEESFEIWRVRPTLA